VNNAIRSRYTDAQAVQRAHLIYCYLTPTPGRTASQIAPCPVTLTMSSGLIKVDPAGSKTAATGGIIVPVQSPSLLWQKWLRTLLA
jgi:hypothetical protein